MVPLKVHFGDETFRDWIDITPAEFYPKPARRGTASHDVAADSRGVRRRLPAPGRRGRRGDRLDPPVSRSCRAPYESAIMAASTAPVPVRVVDSTFVSGAMIFAIDAACAARDADGYLDAVEKAALDGAARTELFFVLDTLDYLVKGGRAGSRPGPGRVAAQHQAGPAGHRRRHRAVQEVEGHEQGDPRDGPARRRALEEARTAQGRRHPRGRAEPRRRAGQRDPLRGHRDRARCPTTRSAPSSARTSGPRAVGVAYMPA